MEYPTDRLVQAAIVLVIAGIVYASVNAMMPGLVTSPNAVIKKVLNQTQQPTLSVSLHSMDSDGYQLFLTSENDQFKTYHGANQMAILQPNDLNTNESYFGSQIMSDGDIYHIWSFENEGDDIQKGQTTVLGVNAYFNYDENGQNIYLNKRYEYFKSQNMDELGFKPGKGMYSGKTIDEKTNPFPMTFLTPFTAQDSKGNLINNTVKFKSISIQSATKQDGSTITKDDGIVEYNKEFTNYKDLFNEIVKYSDKDSYIDNHNSNENTTSTSYIKQVKLNVTYTAQDKDGNSVTTTAPLIINLLDFEYFD